VASIVSVKQLKGRLKYFFGHSEESRPIQGGKETIHKVQGSPAESF
jgi:hypothetical protein